MPLSERVALVTGAGQATGRAIAEALAAAGAAVAVNDVVGELAEEVAAGIEASGGTAVAAVFDITDRSAVGEGVRALEARLGAVDVLVNNAGMPRGLRRRHVAFVDSEPSDWTPWIDLNLWGSMYCLRATLPGMCERGYGRVVQISSGMASRGLPNREAMLGASKAAIEGLLRSVALEVVQDGVTVNTVALGMMPNAVEHADPDVIEAQLARIPMGRPGRYEEAAAAVVWLVSDDGSYMTGQTIHVNGGSYQGR
jgi:NAD(P)-dependent dehydrogenase (short-subunit alcohol dehydrogenase family)